MLLCKLRRIHVIFTIQMISGVIYLCVGGVEAFVCSDWQTSTNKIKSVYFTCFVFFFLRQEKIDTSAENNPEFHKT